MTKSYRLFLTYYELRSALAKKKKKKKKKICSTIVLGKILGVILVYVSFQSLKISAAVVVP
jgi:hypothetical protein